MNYAQGTLAALVDAMVPETPDMADRGEEHVPGGLATGTDEHLAEMLNDAEEVTGGPWALLGYETLPLASVVAFLLDVAALELIVRRRAEAGLRQPAAAFALGPFCRLSRRDRLRTVRLLEDDGLLAGIGTVDYIVQILLSTTLLAYYGDWDGSGQGWDQTGYPGPADGYAALLGYEVDEFAENEY